MEEEEAVEPATFNREPRQEVMVYVPMWGAALDAPRVEIVGDSLLVVQWCRGAWQLKEAQYVPLHQECVELMSSLQNRKLCAPRNSTAWWIRHVYREMNVRADLLAKTCLQSREQLHWSVTCSRPLAVTVYFDGGHKDGQGSSAWTLAVAHTVDANNALQWQTVAEASVYHTSATSVYSEMVACYQAVHALASFLQNGCVVFDTLGVVLGSQIPPYRTM